MATAMLRFLARGWVNELYVLPKFHLAYDGFSWIQPLPGPWMHAHFIALALLACMVAAGFWYRGAMFLFCAGFSYVELIDQTAYLNHYYLISLLSGLMTVLPAQRAWSVDAWLKPALRRDTAPAWTLHLLRFQIGVVYLFAGLAKLNTDWLVHAEPLRIWLAARSELPWIGPFLQPAWVAYAASWSGAIYDLTIVFLLLLPRTRRMAFGAVIVFHVGTWLLFNIGMFPWIMIVAATVFLRPDWPRLPLVRCVARLGDRWAVKAAPQAGREDALGTGAWPGTRLLAAALALYATVQLLLPLRPYLLGGGQPAWSCRGFNLAWQVMVAEKTGYVEFHARDAATGRRAEIHARDYLTPRQAALMAQDPYLVQVLARRISDDLRSRGWAGAQIRVDAYATLNGRPSQRIIDPETDLAAAGDSGWLLPLLSDPPH